MRCDGDGRLFPLLRCCAAGAKFCSLRRPRFRAKYRPHQESPSLPDSELGHGRPRKQQGVLDVKTHLISLAAIGLASILTVLPAAAQTAQRPAGTNVALVDIAKIFEKHPRFNAEMERIKSEIEAFDANARRNATRWPRRVRRSSSSSRIRRTTRSAKRNSPKPPPTCKCRPRSRKKKSWSARPVVLQRL